MACSNAAGESMFGGRTFKILNNAVDISRYSFSRQVRQAYRNELGLESDFVVMTVGRHDPLKRYDFSMKVFSELKKLKKRLLKKKLKK